MKILLIVGSAVFAWLFLALVCLCAFSGKPETPVLRQTPATPKEADTEGIDIVSSDLVGRMFLEHNPIKPKPYLGRRVVVVGTVERIEKEFVILNGFAGWEVSCKLKHPSIETNDCVGIDCVGDGIVWSQAQFKKCKLLAVGKNFEKVWAESKAKVIAAN